MNNFHKEIMKLPKNIRRIDNNSIFGIKNKSSDSDVLPDRIEELCLYLGSNSEFIIQELVKTDYTRDIEKLVIGDSSDSQNYGRDYRRIANILSQTYFPNIKVFEFGIWELLCNEHCIYGKLGDITTILQNMPNLEVVKLCGSFNLRKPIQLKKLKHIVVKLDDDMTGVNGGCISQETFGNLLNSSFPCLTHAWLDLDLEFIQGDDCEEADNSYLNIQKYIFPDGFYAGRTWSGLKYLEISGFYQDSELDKLINCDFVLRNTVDIRIHDYAFMSDASTSGNYLKEKFLIRF